MSAEFFVGEKIKKAWRMKPKKHAGRPSKSQGFSSDPKQVMKQPKKVETDTKKKKGH